MQGNGGCRLKKFVFGSLTAILVVAMVAVGTVAYAGLGFAPVEADVKPGLLETEFMSSVVHASVRRRAPKAQNPQTPTDETLISGGKIYLNDCVGCHGAQGKPSEFGVLFYPPAPQFFQMGTQFSESEIVWIGSHGIRRTGMYPQSYTDDKLWTLAAFIMRAKNLSPSVLNGIQRQQSK
jgi:mono/diheme cytochrome c family protein